MYVETIIKDHLRERYVALSFNAYDLKAEITASRIKQQAKEQTHYENRCNAEAIALKSKNKESFLTCAAIAATFAALIGVLGIGELRLVLYTFALLLFMLHLNVTENAKTISEMKSKLNQTESQFIKTEAEQKYFVDKLIEMKARGVNLREYSFAKAEMGDDLT